MRTPSELPWTALLLYCTAASVTATLALALALCQTQLAHEALRDAKQRHETAPNSNQNTAEPTPVAAVSTHDPVPFASSCSEKSSIQEEDNTAETKQPDGGVVLQDGGVRAVISEPPQHRTAPKPTLDLRSLSGDDVPPELRVSAYFSPQHVREFDHRAVFDGCTSVFAVLDAIRPYLETFFRESAWVAASSQSVNVTILKTSGKRDRDGFYAGDSDDEDDDEDGYEEDDDGENDDHRRHGRRRAFSPSTRKWQLPACIDPAKATEIVLYPGVDPRTFLPDKIVNLDSNAPKFGVVGSPTRQGSAGFQRPMSPSARRYSYGRSSSFDANFNHLKPPIKHLVVSPGALILGGVFDVSDGSIYIGRHVRIEPNAYIKGPCIIGDHSTVRSGAYLRGDLIIGRHVVLRGELKNALILDYAELGHPGYCGDSICGYKSHFGNQVTTANLNLFSNTAFHEILIDTAHARYNTGRKKMGIVLGDFSQLGCSTVTDPGTLLRPNTIVYALTRLRKGVYGPNVVIKNKPLERGVLEMAPLVLPSAEAAAEADAAAAAAAAAEKEDAVLVDDKRQDEEASLGEVRTVAGNTDV